MTNLQHSDIPHQRMSTLSADPRARIISFLLEKLHIGSLRITLPSGRVLEHQGKQPGKHGELHLKSWRTFSRLMSQGDIGFGEAYLAGEWTSPDLVALIRVAAANVHLVDTASAGSLFFRFLNKLRHILRANSLRGSRRNIMSHYDLGNDFYALWLDPSMLYSSALFEASTPDLETAQQNKLARITALLAPEVGQSVLEIGFGWGALAAHLAGQHQVHVTGLTLSPSQLDWASKMIVKRGLDSHIDLRLQDYRDVTGTFDRVVSIEMIEAVGERYWPNYFTKIARSLKPGGRALIQAITIDDARFEYYRSNPDFIQRHIFPGGFLPCEKSLAQQIEQAGLKLVLSERFGLSYAKTLEEWRRRFHATREASRALGFDERFERLWDYYLAYCEAGFLEGVINVGFYLIEPATGE